MSKLEQTKEKQVGQRSDAAGSWLRNFIRFSRPHTIVGTTLSISGLYVLAWAAVRPENARVETLLLALLSCLAANIYIVGLNQVTDVEIDRVNKPELPLASGAFSMATGVALVVGALVLSLLVAAFQGVFLLITVVISVLIGTAYSLPPVRLKRFYFWAAASIFTVRGVVVNFFIYLHFQDVLGGGTGMPLHVWLLTGFVFGLSLVIAWFKDIPDMEGDKRFNVATLSLRLGPQRVFRLGLLLLTFCYGGMILAGLLGVPGVNAPFLVVTHALLLVALWWRARGVDPSERTAMARYYLFIWALFFAEYVLFPLAAVLA